MAKSRKEYMKEAERSMYKILQAYAEEHDTIPDNIQSLIRSACTKANHKILTSLNQIAAKDMGVSVGLAIGTTEYNKLRHEIVEGTNDVNDLRV